jgi:hypothetical protein
MKHMITFHQKSGMAPQIEVPTNITADSRIEARRPKTSARAPQMIEPVTVPVRAAKGSQATMALLTPYSLIMPGTTKPRLAGFMMSMIRATTSTSIRPQWARPSGASSGGVTSIGVLQVMVDAASGQQAPAGQGAAGRDDQHAHRHAQVHLHAGQLVADVGAHQVHRQVQDHAGRDHQAAQPEGPQALAVGEDVMGGRLGCHGRPTNMRETSIQAEP